MRRRIIIHNTCDVLGTAEEVAYGEGYHSKGSPCPYRAPELIKAWQRGRERAKNEGKFKHNYYQGELRNRRFEQPRQQDNNLSEGYAGFPSQEDYKTERGWVGRIFTANGSEILRSPNPFISENSANRWIKEKIAEFAAKGRTVSGKASQTFFDPAYGR